MIILKAARRGLWRRVLLMSAGAVFLMAGAARAQSVADHTADFHIAGGDLDHALTQVADQSGVRIFFPSASVAGKHFAGLSGRLTVGQALGRLLGGSGLSWRLQDGRTIIVSPASSSTITLGPVRVGGSMVRQSATGPGVGYVADNTMAGTKTDTPIIEIPNSVYVVTKQQMTDQQPQNLQEALRYTAGIYSESLGTYGNGATAGSGGSTIQQRGFSTSEFVDGIMTNSYSGAETTFIDRVEVVNGPASVMYGQTTPGGMIGMSLKKPTDTPLRQVSVGFGNWGRYQATVDISDKVTKSGNVRYRVSAIGVTQGTQTDYLSYHRVGVLPSLTWDIDRKTSLTLVGSYMYSPGDGNNYSNQVPTVGSILPSPYGRFPRSKFLGAPNWNESGEKDAMFEYLFRHKFSKYIEFDQTFRWEDSQHTDKYLVPDGMITPTEMSRSAFADNDRNTTIGLDTRLTGKVKTGPAEHTWVVGSDFRQFNEKMNMLFDLGNLNAIDVNGPYSSYNYTPCVDIHSADCQVYKQNGSIHYFQEGVYFQDQIKYKGLSVLLGGRQDWVNYDDNVSSYSNTSDDHSISGGPSTSKPQAQSAFTWRAGLVYKFSFGLAPYFSYSTSFLPQAGSVDRFGRAFAPLRGEQIEAGLKYQLKKPDIFLTAAAFHIDENHYLVTDPADTHYRADAGRVTSKGFEVSAHANITKDLRAIANYTFTDIRYTRTNLVSDLDYADGSTGSAPVSEQGKYVESVPRNMFSVFLDYTPPARFLKGFGFNGGIRYIGFTYSDAVNTYKIPAYFVFDIGAHYDFGKAFSALEGLKAQLAVSNLANKYYITSCAYNFGCYLGQGRRVYGNLTYNW